MGVEPTMDTEEHPSTDQRPGEVGIHRDGAEIYQIDDL
jgi:hypothetical protein